MYLVNTRLDISSVVNSLIDFMVLPKRMHWVVGKRVLRYLCGTVEYGIGYAQGDSVILVGYTNVD